jgi:hypothetical protein
MNGRSRSYALTRWARFLLKVNFVLRDYLEAIIPKSDEDLKFFLNALDITPR